MSVTNDTPDPKIPSFQSFADVADLLQGLSELRRRLRTLSSQAWRYERATLPEPEQDASPNYATADTFRAANTPAEMHGNPAKGRQVAVNLTKLEEEYELTRERVAQVKAKLRIYAVVYLDRFIPRPSSGFWVWTWCNGQPQAVAVNLSAELVKFLVDRFCRREPGYVISAEDLAHELLRASGTTRTGLAIPGAPDAAAIRGELVALDVAHGAKLLLAQAGLTAAPSDGLEEPIEEDDEFEEDLDEQEDAELFHQRGIGVNKEVEKK